MAKLKYLDGIDIAIIPLKIQAKFVINFSPPKWH